LIVFSNAHSVSRLHNINGLRMVSSQKGSYSILTLSKYKIICLKYHTNLFDVTSFLQ